MMLQEKIYANGQKAYTLEGTKLTYFFKNGKIKAEGVFDKGLMEGEWRFYRENGQLWQVGNFAGGKKNGGWIRYDKNGNLEYEITFANDKQVKNKKK